MALRVAVFCGHGRREAGVPRLADSNIWHARLFVVICILLLRAILPYIGSSCLYRAMARQKTALDIL